MSFQPTVGMPLEIAGVMYRVSEHPAVKGTPYGQQGRKGTVYQLQSDSGRAALKVFNPAFREPALVAIAECLAAYAATPGLAACERLVLTVSRHGVLLQQYADLTYAVVMPWIDGPTWAERMADPRGLTPERSATVAVALARLLTGMEERGLAHCDLSGANLLLPLEDDSERVELVDLEEMFAPGLHRPPYPPTGSPGYAHALGHMGIWSREADRFAGGVLLGEILGCCDPGIRQAAWGESYFDPLEMQQECERSRLLIASLRERWGERVSQLFERTWWADLLRECPTFGEWSVALASSPSRAPQLAYPFPADETVAESGVAVVETERLFEDGRGALRKREYAKARELLAEVVRREPDYQRDGQRAATLLAEAAQHKQPVARPAVQPSKIPHSEASPSPEGQPMASAPSRSVADFTTGITGIARGLVGAARRPAAPPPGPAHSLPDPGRLVAALRGQEVRLAQVQASQPDASGDGVVALRIAVRYLREKIEFSFPPASRLQASPQYGDLALQIELFCTDLAAIAHGTPDSTRVHEAKYLADALRAEAEVVVRSLRKG